MITLKGFINSPDLQFQSFKDLSSEPLANVEPSGENATLLTQPLCPLKNDNQFILKIIIIFIFVNFEYNYLI